MTSLEALLSGVLERSPASTERDARPELLDPGAEAGRAALAALLASGVVAVAHDTIRAQLRDLVAARRPELDLDRDPAECDRHVAAHLEGRALAEYGRWVWYPWERRLVHVLPEDELRELRADRNRYKVTAEEAAQLRRARVGVVGLSVGQAIATTLALEGVGGELRLADPDVLEVSNLNRVRAGLATVGVNKAVAAAREIAAFDPYLPLRVFPEGVTAENLDEFLLEGGKLDVVLEECDDFYTKVRLRERCRELGIAVVMSTDDRGLIDVERFDREPHRPLFHGLAGHLEAAPLRGLSTADKVPYVLRILGEDGISPRLAGSLVEIDETISSFPQLASEAQLGGAVATDVVRRLLLGQLASSGRWYVDLERLVRDGGGVAIPEHAAPLGVVACEEARRAPQALAVARVRTVSEEEVRALVAHAVLAPSAHNGQPWRFVWRRGRLVVLHDVERSAGFLDWGHGAAYASIGMAVENLELAAAGMGLASELELFPEPADPRVVCALRFAPGPAESAEGRRLREQIPRRGTNRRRAPRTPLAPDDRDALSTAVARHGARLQLVEDEAQLREAADVVGEGDRFAYLRQDLHAELMEGIRFTPEDAARTRDGIDVATLELSPADAAGLRLVSRWGAMRLVGAVGGGKVLEKLSKKAVLSASAMGLVTIAGTTPTAYFQGGRAIERAWLECTARDLVLHPMAMLPYLFARLERGQAEGYSEKERKTLAALRERWRNLFDVPPDHAEPLLFRLAAKVPPPTARALRRPVADVLSVV
jgi:hypothetical protein